MSVLTPHILGRLTDQPLLIAPGKLSAMIMGLGGRMVEGGFVLTNAPAAIDHTAFAHGQRLGVVDGSLGERLSRNGIRPYSVVNDVAVIAAEGTLVQKGAYLGQSSGETSYQGLQVQIARAREDRSLKGVVFEIDSHGGEVSGGFETAEAIRDLSARLPTMAILTDVAASGGYLLASQCRQIVMPKSGSTGSIGVVSVHLDRSGQMEKEGVRATMIIAGERKVDGNPFEALNPELHETLRARNEATRQEFAAVVAKGRKGRMTKAQALSTEARVYYGQQAVDIGLVDAIAPAAAAFSAFIKAVHPTA